MANFYIHAMFCCFLFTQSSIPAFIRDVPKEIVEKARKESAPWEDIQVRRVKANGEEE